MSSTRSARERRSDARRTRKRARDHGPYPDERGHRHFRAELLEDRLLLTTGPQLVSISPAPDVFLFDGDTLDRSPTELVFRFNQNQEIDPATLGAIQIRGAGFDGSLINGGEYDVTPGFVGIGDRPGDVVVRFAAPLADDLYEIKIVGTGGSPLANTAGEAFAGGADYSQTLDLDLGAQVVAVVPQPISRNAITGALSQATAQVVVYFNNDDLDLSSAQTAAFYQLIDTQGTLTPLDDTFQNPTSVT